MVAWATAAELPRVELGDALALVLLALDSDAPRFDRAAVRWHSRLCREAPLTLDEAQLVLSALCALGGPARETAADTLLGLAERHDLIDVAAVLGGWWTEASAARVSRLNSRGCPVSEPAYLGVAARSSAY